MDTWEQDQYRLTKLVVFLVFMQAVIQELLPLFKVYKYLQQVMQLILVIYHQQVVVELLERFLKLEDYL